MEPRGQSTYLKYQLNKDVKYTCDHSTKTMTLTFIDTIKNSKKEEVILFASILCLSRCAGYVSPFTLGMNVLKIKEKGFKEMNKYGRDLEIYMTTWNVG